MEFSVQLLREGVGELNSVFFSAFFFLLDFCFFS